ncbi:uncharacterized protein N7500_002370 [Penicillium coprophilum]|uniref:uncharacterized protein n=1 Tax=Penicillium coprophilum TaxID=36646 RepID=UPI00239B4C00|nr:uncharacterized protein N7500_002370 [Penicillium coprophilum]KAJ5169587.1 hypothetical protein N7500_002370 [Penicillium coprophilum]
MAIHLEGTMHKYKVFTLISLRRDLCKAGDGSKRLKIVQSVDSQAVLNICEFIYRKSRDIE